MEPAARDKAGEVIVRFGEAILEEPRRFESVLSDLFAGDYRRERIALVTAVRERVPTALRGSAAAHLPAAVLLAQITDRLVSSTAMDADAARWAVDTLAGLMHVPVANASQARNGTVVSQTVLENPSTPEGGFESLRPATAVEPAAQVAPVPSDRPVPLAQAPPKPRRHRVKTIGMIVLSVFGIFGLLFFILVVIDITNKKGENTAGGRSPTSRTGAPPNAAPLAADIANSFVPYRDGATWYIRCTFGSQTADFAEHFAAAEAADVPNLAVFRTTLTNRADGSIQADRLEGADAHGNAYLVGTYTGGVLKQEPVPILLVPIEPRPGFTAHWNDRGVAITRSFIRTADAKTKSGVTVHEAIFRDYSAEATTEQMYIQRYGFAFDVSQPTGNAPQRTCRRNS
ncbi:MAG: hypothetical protein NVSMB5_14120 [Candidatus Velthaea sp.]